MRELITRLLEALYRFAGFATKRAPSGAFTRRAHNTTKVCPAWTAQ